MDDIGLRIISMLVTYECGLVFIAPFLGWVHGREQRASDLLTHYATDTEAA